MLAGMAEGTQKNAIERAIAIAGTQEALADRLSVHLGRVVNQQNISYMKRTGRASAKMVEAIEAVTGVSRHDLRPDLYPAEESAA